MRRVPPERLGAASFGDSSALDLIGHLADTAELFAERVRRCVEEPSPYLPDVDTDALVRERRATRDARECSNRITAAHRLIVRLLQRPGVWEWPATHGAQGSVNAGHLAAYQARHSQEHVTELSRMFPPS